MTFLFFALGMIGITLIIVDSKLMLPVRNGIKESKIKFLGHELYDMVTCHQCCGFWVGFLCWPSVLPFIHVDWTLLSILSIPVIAIMSGAAMSYLAMLARAIIDWLTLNIQIPPEMFDEEETQ